MERLVDPGSIHWICHETQGWLGFKSPTSGNYLGHDKQGKLSCFSKRHSKWEWFYVRIVPQGGFVLLMTHWDRLQYVEVVKQDKVVKVAKTERGVEHAAVWEFIKVQEV